MKLCVGAYVALLMCASVEAGECLDCAPLCCDDVFSCADSCDTVCCNESLFDCSDLLASLLDQQSLIVRGDHCFDDFISPMTNPIFFEDPRTVSELRFIFANHSLPNELLGGDAQLYAMQVRAALTEKLSIVAAKDGFIVSQNPLLDDGWADVAAGLKYNIFKDVETQTIVSVGASYELPIGSTRALQGNGDGEFHLYASAGKEIAENWHYVTGSGFRLPSDTNEETQVWYWSNHLDYQIAGTSLYLLGETNWYHWMKSGTAFPVAVEGIDLFNLGAVGVAGNDIVTGAIGLKWKPSRCSELGIAWELPLTDRRGVMHDRLTVDYIIRY